MSRLFLVCAKKRSLIRVDKIVCESPTHIIRALGKILYIFALLKHVTVCVYDEQKYNVCLVWDSQSWKLCYFAEKEKKLDESILDELYDHCIVNQQATCAPANPISAETSYVFEKWSWSSSEPACSTEINCRHLFMCVHMYYSYCVSVYKCKRVHRRMDICTRKQTNDMQQGGRHWPE